MAKKRRTKKGALSEGNINELVALECSNQNKLHSHLTNFSTNAHFQSQCGILRCI